MKTKIQIKSTWGSVLFEHESENNSIKKALVEAIKKRANLMGVNLRGTNLMGAYLSGVDFRGANLSGSDLRGVDLSEANLSGANLSGVNLSGAYLSGADFRETNLRGADFREANLSGANLMEANLRGANLRGANLRGANLRGADLRGVDLRGVNLSGVDFMGVDLSGAYLRGANLSGADLREANLMGADFRGADLMGVNLKKIIDERRIVPEKGSFIAWKKAGDCVIELEIPAEAKRHNSINGRKCRAEFVKVLDIRNSRGHKVKEAHTSNHGPKTIYKVGEIVKPDSYDPDPLVECSNGIHFFVSRQEAKDW